MSIWLIFVLAVAALFWVACSVYAFRLLKESRDERSDTFMYEVMGKFIIMLAPFWLIPGLIGFVILVGFAWMWSKIEELRFNHLSNQRA